MPNDPRVKFKKKKMYDPSHNLIHFGGGGGNGARSRSIFEEGNIPRPPGGGEPPNQIDIPTYRNIEPIPQPLKPGLNPGEITGITIGTLAGLGTLEVSRRAYLQYLEEQRRGRGAQIVSQSDEPIKARRGGNTLERSRIGVSRAINSVTQSIANAVEMTSTRTIQSEFAPLSIQSSPSSSGASTPVDLQSARSRSASGASTPSDLQSARSRSSSGASTPGEINSLFPNSTGFRQQTIPQQTPMAEALASAQTKIPAPQMDILNPEQLLAQLQLEIQNPNISEARSKTLQSKIRALEREIEMTNLRRQAPATVAAPPPEPPPEPIANRTRSKAGNQLNEELQQAKKIENLGAIERAASKQQRISENIETSNADLAKVNVPRQEVYLKGRLTANLNKLEKTIAEIELKLLNVDMPNAQRTALLAQQERYRRQLATVDATVEARRSAINKTVTTEINTSVHTPANDNLRATQPTREFESRLRPIIETEMQGVRREYFPEIGDIVQAAMQQMGSRKPLERAKVGQTPNFEGELIGPQFSERQAAGVGVDFNAPRPLVENRPEPQRPTTIDPFEAEPQPAPRPASVEELAIDAEMARLQKRLNEVRNATGPIENIPEGTKIQARAQATETAVDKFNKMYDTMVEKHLAEGYEIATAPEGMTAIESKKYIMDEIINESVATERPLLSGDRNPVEITPEQAFTKVQAKYDKALSDPTTQRPVEAPVVEENIGIARTKKGKGKLTKKTGLLATEEQRMRPTALAGEAQARVRGTAPAEVRAGASVPETARTGAPIMETARATAAPAPETAARRRMGVPELTAPEPTGPRVRAQVESINTSSRPAPPIEEPAPSAPPSAPESEVATPREGIVTERTPAERASFAEEVKLGMSKKIPGRQKVKINVGKTNNTTRNPLDIFVNPQFRNTPNLEIHPSAKNLRGALSELGARVPKLVPSKKVLISVGSELASEGGGMIAGFYAGSEAGKAMSNYFATHPPKNRGEEYGQALATSMVALGVGNLVSKAVTYAIRQGIRIALGAQISGSISGAGTAGLSALAEAALFATVATTTQFYVTKALEDEGNSHAYSRAMGAFAATEALVYTDIAMWLAKGGPFNPAGDLSFIASEVFIIGFGIYSTFEEYFEGKKQDEEGEAYEAEARAERQKAEQDRRDAITALNTTNNAKATFLRRLPTYNYDFDALYERLTEQEKTELGILTPESKMEFQRQVERTFDPFSSFEKSESGLKEQPVLTQVEKDRGEVMSNYINWYIDELRGVRHPPFNFDDPKVRELTAYSGGTWQSAAKVSASTNYLQAEQVHPLISKAQNEIVDAFHNERKTIEQMDPLTVRYATLDSTFRENYEAYIVTDAAAQILIEFNTTQYTYNDVDPALLAIADRDPNFRAAADNYYQVLANQARDYNLSISEVARLNSLMETQQVVEIGKLNDARNAIVNKNQAENQAMVDAYNANILREINIYGTNFDAIIRNINEQSLLSGHTFLYASNRADLYRQLHLEVPEVEFVDPPDEVDKPNATWHAGKGRKVGDTGVYGYRYNLTDEQNQEIEDLISSNKISRFDAEKQALVIYNRDRAKFVQTDQEKASDLGLTLAAYYEKFGIVEPTIISTEPTYEQLQTMYPDQYRTLQQKYKNDPDANTKIQTTLRKGHNARMAETGGVFTPTGQAEDLTVEQLQKMYPNEYLQYTNVYSNNGKTPLTEETIKAIEIMLRETHRAATNAGTAPAIPPEPTRDPTYEELKVMYPEQFDIYNDANSAIGQEDKTETMLRKLHTRRTASGTAPDIPGLGEVTPVNNELKNGVLNMPDGSTRIYKNGLVVNVMYPNGTELSKAKNSQEINAAEGQQNADYTPTTGPATTLRQGDVTMPDGSKRIYIDGKVVSVSYPEGTTGSTLNEINAAEGVKQAEPPATQRPGLDVIPEFKSGSRSHEYMNATTRANDAAGISNINNEPENP